MKNFVYQTFILLPLTAAATFGLVMFIGPFFYLENAGDWSEEGLRNTAQIFFMILFFALFVVSSCIYLRVRGFKAGTRWWWYGLALSPIRQPLQLIACIISVIFAKSTKVISDYEFAESEDNRNNVISLFFNFEVRRPYVPKYKTEKPEKKEEKEQKPVPEKVEKSDNKLDGRKKVEDKVPPKKEKKNSRFGEEKIKSRNIIFQICVLLPITALQCFLTVFFIKSVIYREAEETWQMVCAVLAIIALPILAGIVAQIRGHAASYEYFDKRIVMEEKKSGMRASADYDGDPDEFDNAKLVRKADEKGYKKVSGGWNSVISLTTVFSLLCSGFMVAFQIISVIIAIFSNPYEGRLFSWYGKVNYDYCNHPFAQKILHFFFGCVVLAY